MNHHAPVDAQLDAVRADRGHVARLARFGYGSIEIKGEPDQYDTKDVREMLSPTTG